MRRIRRVAEWTPLIVVGIVATCGLLDYLLLKLGDNDATISFTLLLASAKNPIVAHLNAYMFAVFLGHVYFPSGAKVAPPTYAVLSWAIVALSPCIAACIIVASGGGMRPHESITDPVYQLKFGGVMLVWIIGGLLVGRFVLKQHPFATPAAVAAGITP